MGMRALPLSSSNNYCCPPSLRVYQNVGSRLPCKAFNTVRVWAKLDDDEKGNKEEAKKTNKQSLFGSVTEALDFSQVRSPKDAQLLEEAREATKSGGKMSREQYGALRRKIGGTYKDFFKSYIEAKFSPIADVSVRQLGRGAQNQDHPELMVATGRPRYRWATGHPNADIPWKKIPKSS